MLMLESCLYSWLADGKMHRRLDSCGYLVAELSLPGVLLSQTRASTCCTTEGTSSPLCVVASIDPTASGQNKQITFEPFSKENPRPAPPLETRRKRKRKAIDIPDDDEEEEQNTSGATEDVLQVKEEEDLDTQPLFRPDFDDEDEDEKPEGKPKLRVSYDGFSIFGK